MIVIVIKDFHIRIRKLLRGLTNQLQSYFYKFRWGHSRTFFNFSHLYETSGEVGY